MSVLSRHLMSEDIFILWRAFKNDESRIDYRCCGKIGTF